MPVRGNNKEHITPLMWKEIMTRSMPKSKAYPKKLNEKCLV